MSPVFGTHLESLAGSDPVWIVQSPANDPIIEKLWNAKAGNITRFDPQPFGQLIDTVDQHHPGWRTLEVYGLDGHAAIPALTEYGGGAFTFWVDGFLFERSDPQT